MKVHFLEPGFAISDEVALENFSDIQQQGFKAVICNRRVGEEGYESEELFRQAAERAGLQWFCVPVASGEYTEADVEAFGKALDNAPAPVLGFCRTGRRAVHMWAQSRAQDPQCNIPMLLKAAHEAGHDPQPIRELLGETG
ncbi:TIGR01244 family sulfur transferase [Marinobacter shengliensis]|uniref:TIGR01244 family sulfur transferase n=1 Tax=Marinobacter shengliensis TaxID=1389223 RepID=A0ABV4W912_9GAMM